MFRAVRVSKTLAAAALRGASLAAVRPVRLPMSVPVMAGRAFSTEKKLAKTLVAELEHEESNAESNEDLQEVQKTIEQSFKISTKVGESTVILTREYKGEHIEVKFDVQDVDDLNESFEEEEGETEAIGYAINFSVTITKNDSKLVFACSGSDGITVHNVRSLPANKANDDADAYGGPSFDDLDESLTGAFMDYLEERKVDADLGYFVMAYSQEKENKEYANWLKTVHNFISK